MSEATFSLPLRLTDMDKETIQQILTKIESMERGLEQLMEILKPKQNENE